MNYWNEESLVVPCPKCKAEIGQRCRATSGKFTGYPHVDRTAPLYDSWRQGHREGRQMMARTVMQHVDGGITIESLRRVALLALEES